jgi:hypothetical protein
MSATKAPAEEIVQDDNEFIVIHFPETGAETTATRRALRLVWGPRGYVEGPNQSTERVLRNEVGVVVTDPKDAVEPVAINLEQQAQAEAFQPTGAGAADASAPPSK